jgi:hypothetical protein
MRVVGDAELIWNRQQDRIGFGDRLVLPKLLDENIRFSSVHTTEDCLCVSVNTADFVLFLASSAAVAAITIAASTRGPSDQRYRTSS